MDKRRRPVAFEGTCAEAAPDVARKSVRFGSLSIEVATDAAREAAPAVIALMSSLLGWDAARRAAEAAAAHAFIDTMTTPAVTRAHAHGK